MNQPLDYDRIAGVYEARYQRNQYPGVERALAEFVSPRQDAHQPRVLEVGCGTGHWLKFLQDAHIAVVGLDPSRGMLQVANACRSDGHLIRARAEALPLGNRCFARIFCVNALHHFTDPAAFFREARRVLDRGGGLLTVGLDPSRGEDRWWIYDYFPQTLAEDQKRYLPASRIRELMEVAGFSRCETREIQHLPRQVTVDEAARSGFLERASTSQLMVISEAEYEAGLKRIHAANDDAARTLMLCADLRIYGTTGWAAEIVK